MSQVRNLTLIAPRISPALAQAIADRAARWPGLARLAGRGSVALLVPEQRQGAASLQPWQSALLDVLGLRHASDDYPSAAVIRTGQIGEPASGYWLQALPLHFSAGLDRLTAVPLQATHAVSDDERAQIELLIRAHLQEYGFELRGTAGESWLLCSERALELDTAAPETAIAHPLDEMLPRGRDAGELRRLMTELQMLLHEHPVNARRQARGALAINAIWFHGAGMLGDVRRSALPDAFGAEPYLRGLYRLHGQEVRPAVADATALLSEIKSDAIVLADAADLDALEERWIVPLSRALSTGMIACLTVLLDRWQLLVPRAAAFKIWRRQRPPAKW